MIDTFQMQARRGAIPESCQVFFPCSESSGVIATDRVGGLVLSPGQAGYSGSMAFGVSNAITFTNDTDGAYTPLLAGAWPTLDLTKVIISAAVVRIADATKARLPVGNITIGSGFSVSFAGNMHTVIANDAADQVAVAPDATKAISNDLDCIILLIWDGTTSTLTSKVLNTDGSQYNNGTADVTQTTTAALSGGTITPEAVSRIGGLHVFEWAIWELDTRPSTLEHKLSAMSALARAGTKGVFELL